MKIIKIALGIIVLLAIVGVAVFNYFFRSAVPDYSGTVFLEGLASQVEVRTDQYGIPHIYADNEPDLFFAQGYIMARERLFQMDTTRLAGRGELSTLFGDITLDKDRFLRTVGFYRKAQKSYEVLLPETKAALKAFSAGVNRYIETADTLPREYFFLKSKPKPWEPADSIVVGLLMSYSLTRSKKIDLIMHRIGEKAGYEIMKAIIPSFPDIAPTLTGKRPTYSDSNNQI